MIFNATQMKLPYQNLIMCFYAPLLFSVFEQFRVALFNGPFFIDDTVSTWNLYDVMSCNPFLVNQNFVF